MIKMHLCFIKRFFFQQIPKLLLCDLSIVILRLQLVHILCIITDINVYGRKVMSAYSSRGNVHAAVQQLKSASIMTGMVAVS